MEREHHEAEERHHERDHERSFTPGHFTPGDLEDYKDYHEYGRYH